MHKRMVVLAVAIVLVSFPVSHAWAQDIEARESLSRLPGVQVIVEGPEADAERDGLTADAIKTDIELRLQQAGITVFLRGLEDAAAPAFPKLFVSVHATKHRQSNLYAVYVSVELTQQVLQLVTGDVGYGATWGRGGALPVESGRLRSVRDPINDIVDEFIKDWLAVHPQ